MSAPAKSLTACHDCGRSETDPGFVWGEPERDYSGYIKTTRRCEKCAEATDRKSRPFVFLFYALLFAGVAWFSTWEPSVGVENTRDLMGLLASEGVQCEQRGIDTVERTPGTAAENLTDMGGCEIDGADVHFFVWKDSKRANSPPSELHEIYGGLPMVSADNWYAITPDFDVAQRIREALDADFGIIDGPYQPPEPFVDRDCGDPGVAENLPVVRGDPHGLDNDGDGIGCET